MRVGLYIRTSTVEQNSELQHRELTGYAAARGWTIQQVYEDRASGSKGDRPEYLKLRADARQRKVDIVLVWRLDRWARSLKEVVLSLEEFNQIGVKFVSLKDNLDLTTATGILMLQIIAAFGEFERNIIKQRVSAGMLNAKAKGVKIGRPRHGKEAEVRRLHGSGLSYSKIAERTGLSKAAISRALRGVPKSRKIGIEEVQK